MFWAENIKWENWGGSQRSNQHRCWRWGGYDDSLRWLRFNLCVCVCDWYDLKVAASFGGPSAEWLLGGEGILRGDLFDFVVSEFIHDGVRVGHGFADLGFRDVRCEFHGVLRSQRDDWIEGLLAHERLERTHGQHSKPRRRGHELPAMLAIRAVSRENSPGILYDSHVHGRLGSEWLQERILRGLSVGDSSSLHSSRITTDLLCFHLRSQEAEACHLHRY